MLCTVIDFVEASRLEGMRVGFENCECVYVPSEFIHNLDVSCVRKNKYLSGFNGDCEMRDITVAMYVNVVVTEYGDTPDILEKCTLYSDEYDTYDGYTRLCDSGDITSLEFIYKDGTVQDVYVNYSLSMGSEPNANQKNTPIISRDVPRGLGIRIASPETLKRLNPERDEIIAVAEEIVKEEIVKEERVIVVPDGASVLNKSDFSEYQDFFDEMDKYMTPVENLNVVFAR